MDPAELQARIDEIDSILQTGASSATLDGVSVSWDYEALRKERADLQTQLESGSRRKKRRPMIFRNTFG